MEYDRELGRRFGLGLLVLSLFAIAAYIIEAFIAVVVFAIFLYYSVRPIHRFLRRFGLPRQLRAALAIILFGVPFVILIVYTLAIIILEIQALIQAYGIQDELLQQAAAEADVAGIDQNQLQDAIAGAGVGGSLIGVFTNLTGALSVVSSAFIQLLIIIVVTYYMLIDGPRLKRWFLDTFDDTGIIRQYVDEVDPEISLTLFGNIVNVFVTAIAGIVVFFSYNFFAPGTVQIPFPGLLGALAGIGSLIPVFGIKLVYIPVVIGLAAAAIAAGQTELLLYVGALALVAGIVVDFIPDFFIRALISGDHTHTGMLLVSYIIGPALFGFYGLFLLPILLILFINANRVLLPYILWGEETPAQQTTFDEFGGNDHQPPPAARKNVSTRSPLIDSGDD